MAIEIFKLFGSIFVDNEAANNSISATDEKAKSVASTLGKGIGTAAKWGTAIVGSTTVAAGGMLEMANSSATVADEVDKMSAKIGLSKQGYQEWKYVLGQNGIEIDKMQTGMKTLVSNMDSAASGTASAQEMFSKLGVSITDSNGKLKGQEDMMNEVLLKLADMPNGTEKARLATELFGKAGVELMPMLNNGAQGIKDLTARSHELGLIMSDEAVNAGVVLGDTMDDVKQSIGMLGTNLGATLFPIIQKVCDAIIQYLPKIQNLVGKLAPIFSSFLEKIVPVLFDLGSSLLPIIMDLIEQLMPVISQLMQVIAPIITQLVELLLPPLISIVQTLLPPLMNIITALVPLIQTVFALLTPFVALIMQILQPLSELLSTALAPLIEKLTTLINELLQPIIPIFQEITAILLESLTPVFEALSPVFDVITEALTPVFNLLNKLLKIVLPALIPVVQSVANIFSGGLGNAFKFIKSTIDNIMSVFSGLVTFITGVFSGDWSAAWDGIVNAFKGVFNGIPTAVEWVINSIINLFNGIIDGINFVAGWTGFTLERVPLVELPRFRAGIDNIPNDKFPAYLDAGEAVLNAQEAEEYRQAKRENGVGNVFNQNPSNSVVNNITVNISGVTVSDENDIDELAEKISQKLAAEMTKKAGVFG